MAHACSLLCPLAPPQLYRLVSVSGKSLGGMPTNSYPIFPTHWPLSSHTQQSTAGIHLSSLAKATHSCTVPLSILEAILPTGLSSLQVTFPLLHHENTSWSSPACGGPLRPLRPSCLSSTSNPRTSGLGSLSPTLFSLQLTLIRILS